MRGTPTEVFKLMRVILAGTLIGAGFKELRLLDFDTLELSNLTRQILFTDLYKIPLGSPECTPV
ncbi:hypothetical protein NIES4071_67020 [Calothrix sp. NIES-4071]|nr:hypothetical protein NIES4071_67020 [Calothrix sp. NIES-4071]BAZ60980.1 hypothetical protein NIES4105_66980 [Calothrix sp. NIES-4105]